MKPCWSGLNQCVVAIFQSVVLFFWKKLMNLLRPSITAILQHRTDGCSNGCSSIACTMLYIVKKHPLLMFLKCGLNNWNSYNLKTHVIRTCFESPWGFALYQFNCIFRRRAVIYKRSVKENCWNNLEQSIQWKENFKNT